MRKRRGERDADGAGALIRAWRWLRSSGYYEDDQAKPGPAPPAPAKERFWRGRDAGLLLEDEPLTVAARCKPVPLYVTGLIGGLRLPC